jgi:hypothetical protein
MCVDVCSAQNIIALWLARCEFAASRRREPIIVPLRDESKQQRPRTELVFALQFQGRIST